MNSKTNNWQSIINDTKETLKDFPQITKVLMDAWKKYSPIECPIKLIAPIPLRYAGHWFFFFEA